MPADHDTLIAEAEGLCAAATPGPWSVEASQPNCVKWVDTADNDYPWSVAIAIWACPPGHDNSAANAAFIARARTLIPELLAALRPRPGREEVERRLKLLTELGGNVREAIMKNWPVVAQHEANRDAWIADLLNDLGYGAGDGR